MALPCPNCGADLRLIEEYGRQYCDACGQYAPEGYGGGMGLNCPKCGGVLTFIKEYDRYYCHKDQEYAAEDLGRAEPAPPPLEPEIELSSIDDLLPPEPEPEATSTDTPPVAEVQPAAAPAPPPTPVPEVPAATPPAAAVAPKEGPRIEPRPEPKREVARPPLVRDEILRAKKAALMDLAAAYDLDTMGTKEDLRERLFATLVELEKDEERRRKEERAKAEEAERATAPSTTPEPAPSAAEPSPSSVEAPVSRTPATESPAAPAAANPPFYDPPPVEAPARTMEESPPEVSMAGVPRVEITAPRAETPAALPAIAPEAPRVINPCPTCGRELTYIEKYDRYYCDNCKAYAPPVVRVVAVPAPPKVGKPCPTCGRELTYIPDYGRHYCYHCKKYAALEGRAEPVPSSAVEVLPPKPEPTPAPAPPAIEIVAVRNPCPTCGRELSYIERYGRFYCYSCRKYAPARPRNPCPNCGKELSFIAQYGRHYCPACGQYAPKELTAQILAARSAAVTATMAGGVARPVAVSAAATRTVTIPVHHHGSPGGAIGLAAAGLVILLIYEFLWAMPAAFGGLPYVSFDPSNLQTTLAIGWMLQFLGFLMIGLAVVVGLIRVRTSK